MSPVKTIMVAIDFSDYSQPTLRFAAGLCTQVGGRLLLVNIINQRDTNAMERALRSYDGDLLDRLFDDDRRDRRNKLLKLSESVDCLDRIWKVVVRTGVPYRELLAIINEEKPDILVMATKGRGNLADTILGSCAQKMYRRSPIPLLSIRPAPV